MKIAKKVLAIAMAVGMIFCLTAMAFAATPSVDFVVNGADVTVVLKDAVGLTSADLVFSVPETVTGGNKVNGADAKAIGDIDNAFSSEWNFAEGKLSFYFKQENYTSAQWKELAADLDQEAAPNGEAFQAIVVKFKTEAENVEVKVTGTAMVAGAPVAVDTTVVLNPVAAPETTTAAPVVEPTTAAPVEETTAAPVVEETTAAPAEETTVAAPETTTVAPATSTDPEKKPAGTVDTGDTAALAVAMGVCALAGAAFVATKKRK